MARQRPENWSDASIAQRMTKSDRKRIPRSPCAPHYTCVSPTYTHQANFYSFFTSLVMSPLPPAGKLTTPSCASHLHFSDTVLIPSVECTDSDCRQLYSFPRASVTKHHSLCGLKQKFIVSRFWRLEIWSQSVGKVHSRETVLCLFPNFWWWLVILGIPWLTDASLHSLPLSSNGPLSSNMMLFDLITSTKNLFTNKVRVLGLPTYLFGEHNSTHKPSAYVFCNQTHLSFPLPFLAWSLKSLEPASFISFVSFSLISAKQFVTAHHFHRLALF